MLKRGQAERVRRVAETRVLSTPPQVPLAPVITPVMMPGEGVPKRTRSAASTQPDHPDAILNAYWSRSDLILVVPSPASPNGVRFLRQKAEHSTYIRIDHLVERAKTRPAFDPMSLCRRLNSSAQVRSCLLEGEWMRVSYHDRDQLRAFCKSCHTDGLQTYEGMVSPVLKHMVDNKLRPAKPRQIYLDIETDSRVPFSRAIEGHARILSWALVDKDEVTVATGLLDQDTDEDEKRILIELWASLDHYDQVMAWAGERFDFPVIKARSERYGLLRASEREWKRWLWLDHLELFRRMNMSASESGDEKQSMKLNSVAMSVLGEGKDDFDSSKTWEAWVAGGAERARLLAYNIQDTRLMPAIEKKTGFIMLLQTVADTCGTFPDSRGSNPGVQVEGFLARLAHERGYKHPTVIKVSEASGSDAYLGAYVLHPEKNAGIHKNVHVADFAALYPSIIRTWNMSPETIMEGGEWASSYPRAHSPLTGENFRTDIAGILPEAVKQLMGLRAKWNTLKASLPPGTDAWKDADRRAAAYKITTNSFYGVIGAPTSRFYSRKVAESVTQCGRWLLEETMKAADRLGMRVIYGDTDSLFVVGSDRSAFEDFVEDCNTRLYPAILADLGCEENTVKLAYEKEFSRLVLTTAKKYAGSYAHYKGTDANQDSHPEIKGLEFKRGDSIKITRQLQEELAHLLVGFKQPASDTPEDYVAIIQRWREKVLHGRLELSEVMTSKRLNKAMDDYHGVLVDPKTKALSLGPGATAMLRIAFELEERGQDVGEGAKVDYVVVDASKTPQQVIPAEDYDPDNNILDRDALWDKAVWPPNQRLMEAAFPAYPWKDLGQLVRTRKAVAKDLQRAEATAQKQAAKDAAKAAKEAAKVVPPPALASPPPRRRMVKAAPMCVQADLNQAAHHDAMALQAPPPRRRALRPAPQSSTA